MKLRKFSAIATFACLLLCATTLLSQGTAQDQLRQGAEAYNNGNYAEATEHFQKAVDLDPNSLLARLHLANALSQESMASPPSPDAEKLAEQGLRVYRDILSRDPQNKLALWDAAILATATGRALEAKQWCLKLSQADPQNKEAYYMVGVLDWVLDRPQDVAARSRAGMQPDQPGPITDAKVRQDLQQSQLTVIDEGLGMLAKAIEIDPNYYNAIAYSNMLYRAKADMAENDEAGKALLAKADQLVQKAMQLRNQQGSEKPVPSKLDPALPPPPLPPVPPPPPPPPPE